MQLRTILVPYDFSPPAERALVWALALAEKSKATIFLLHVVPELSSLSHVERLSALDMQYIEAQLVAEAEQRLQEVTETLPPEAGIVPALWD